MGTILIFLFLFFIEIKLNHALILLLIIYSLAGFFFFMEANLPSEGAYKQLIIADSITPEKISVLMKAVDPENVMDIDKKEKLMKDYVKFIIDSIEEVK